LEEKSVGPSDKKTGGEANRISGANRNKIFVAGGEARTVGSRSVRAPA